jgi:hypothetical protein
VIIVGPDTKYAMQWGGKWRPVVNMIDRTNRQTDEVTQCAKVVLYISEDEWVAARVVTPGDLVERVDRDADARFWETDC